MLSENGLVTLEEINEKLPNGLHDAEVEVITEDLRTGSLRFQVFVWVGTMDGPPSQRERYRRGELRFENVERFAISSPRNSDGGHSVILSFDRNSNLPPEYKASSPFGESSYRMFFGCTEMDITAQSVQFDWIESAEINRDPE